MSPRSRTRSALLRLGAPATALLLVLGITSTTASFTTRAEVRGALDGDMDIALGPCDEPVQASTPDEAHLVVDQESTEPVRRSSPDADGVPSSDSATFGVTVCNLAAVDGALTLSVYDRAAPDTGSPFGDLVLTVRDGDDVVVGPGAVPAPDLSVETGGVAVPAAVRGQQQKVLTLEVWLRDGAPPEAFSQAVDLGIRIVGRGVAGEIIELTGKVG